MFGRTTRILALLATITHVWVSLVAAPWHQIVAHTLATAKQAVEVDSKTATHRCPCGHHHHCSDESTTADSSPSQQSHLPVAPEDHDDCSICQALTVGVIHIDPPTIDVVVEQKVLTAPVASIEPTHGVVIEPVSRGPPVA